jgi:hypothetical protein
MGFFDMRSEVVSRFEIEHLLELLNSNQQEPGIRAQPIQPLVERENVNLGNVMPEGAGIDNRFVAHISQALSKTRSGPFGVS